MRIGMIWAQATGGVIGRGGTMPWHLPEDLAHFKATTLGAPVIMGRRTWESLPETFRPLPGRTNIVVTRTLGYQAAGATIVSSLDSAITHAGDSGEATDAVWIIGGGQLYREAMSVATELVVTQIELEVPDGDTFAPEIGPEWMLDSRSDREVSTTGLGYVFERYVRRSRQAQAVA